MSNSLAIAAVTSTIRYLLEGALAAAQPGAVGGAGVTTLHPSRLVSDEGDPPKGVNVFLYRVTPNHAWNLTDLPTRAADGRLVHRPVAALDLHYLISCTGDDAELDAQRLLARTVLALAVSPVLGRDLVSAAIDEYADDVPTAFLAESDLADSVELVKLSPETLSVEDESRLWGTLAGHLQLSATYLATVVLLEPDVHPRTALPVRARSVTVAAAAPLVVAEVATDPALSPVGSGTQLVVRGSKLLPSGGTTAAVRIGPARLTPQDGSNAGQLLVTVDDTVPAGVHALQVVHGTAAGPGGTPPARTAVRSNGVPIVVRPEVTAVAASATGVTLTVSPPLFPRQRATVVLSPLGPDDGREPVTFTLAPIAADGVPSPTVEVSRDAVADGDWLVRLVVDGADSVPRLVGETYGEPRLSLP